MVRRRDNPDAERTASLVSSVYHYFGSVGETLGDLKSRVESDPDFPRRRLTLRHFAAWRRNIDSLLAALGREGGKGR